MSIVQHSKFRARFYMTYNLCAEMLHTLSQFTVYIFIKQKFYLFLNISFIQRKKIKLGSPSIFGLPCSLISLRSLIFTDPNSLFFLPLFSLSNLWTLKRLTVKMLKMMSGMRQDKIIDVPDAKGSNLMQHAMRPLRERGS